MRDATDTFFAHALGSSTPVETFFTPARGSSTPVETFFAHAWGSSTPVETLFAPACGSSTTVETFFAPACGSSTTVETFFAPARGSSTTVEIFFAHAHPKWLIFDHFHRAGAIFLSQRHPERPPGATQGRSFFHAAPRDDTESPPVWRAPRGMGPGHGAGGWRPGRGGPLTATSRARLEGAGGTGGPGCGARRRWRGLAGQRGDAPSEARGADGSRAGRRPRAHKAARPANTPHGTQNTSGATSSNTREQTARGADGERAGSPRGGRISVGATSPPHHVGITKPPDPTGAGRLRQSARETQRRITTISGSPRPLS